MDEGVEFGLPTDLCGILATLAAIRDQLQSVGIEDSPIIDFYSLLLALKDRSIVSVAPSCQSLSACWSRVQLSYRIAAVALKCT